MQGLPHRIASRLRLPLIAAPMLRISGPELVGVACESGIIGAFPTANARSEDELDGWLARLHDQAAAAEDRTGRATAPICPNLIMREGRLNQDLGTLVRHRVELVITSVGSPSPAIAPLHDVGCLVLADVATLHHAERAIEAGADGLVLLSAGAGGQTGWMNPLAFARSIRSFFSGPLILAGGIADGAALWAAQVLGCDLAYMGTKFIATAESRAASEYRDMLLAASMDDVQLTSAFTGLPTNMLRSSIVAAGLDPANLDEKVSMADADGRWGQEAGPSLIKRWRDIWSAGHSVSGVDRIQPAAELIEQTLGEYRAARAATSSMLGRQNG